MFLTVDGYTHRVSRASVGACGSFGRGDRRFTTGRCREASPRSSARKPQTATDPQPKLAGLAAGWRAVRRNLGFDEGECQASCQRTGVHTNSDVDAAGSDWALTGTDERGRLFLGAQCLGSQCGYTGCVCVCVCGWVAHGVSTRVQADEWEWSIFGDLELYRLPHSLC